MISEEEFDIFLKTGFIDGITPYTSLNKIIGKYGNDNWTNKEVKNCWHFIILP